MGEKFTPGPWGNNGGTVESAAGWHVATAHGNGGGQLDNAYLIAAAPDMYAALNKMCRNGLELGYCNMSDCNNCQTMVTLKKARVE
jgi:hypothetical protein